MMTVNFFWRTFRRYNWAHSFLCHIWHCCFVVFWTRSSYVCLILFFVIFSRRLTFSILLTRHHSRVTHWIRVTLICYEDSFFFSVSTHRFQKSMNSSTLWNSPQNVIQGNITQAASALNLHERPRKPQKSIIICPQRQCEVHRY